MQEMKIKIDGVEIELTKEQIDKINKPKDITDRIKTMDDVYSELGIDKTSFEKSFLFSEDLYASKVRLITKALNQGWIPNWSNKTEYKYVPYFKISGVGFSGSGYGVWRTFTLCGSRLCFKSKELCLYAVKQFNAEFENHFIIK